MDKNDYLQRFVGEYEGKSRQAKALELALDIRKFEIELYWKRTAYFWAFTAAAFAGYGAVQKDAEPSKAFFSVLLGCLGFVFSFAWFCINKGSKYWQSNWETHVDLLEDAVLGPLYKTIGERGGTSAKGRLAGVPGKLRRIASGPYAFSVSKINQILSLLITLMWIPLIWRSIPPIGWNLDLYGWIMSAIVACVVLVWLGRTDDVSSKYTLRQRAANLK